MTDAQATRPIKLIVFDDLRRSRLTVFFRLLLSIPHLIWWGLWSATAIPVWVVTWVAVVVTARAPRPLHRFAAAYVRYTLHFGAYLCLAANPFPGFVGKPGYPVDIEIEPAARQSRLGAFFRVFLAIPALLLAGALRGGGYAWGALAACAFLGWFAALVLGRMPRGLRDLSSYALGYNAQALGYTMLVSGRYPSSDPALVSPPLRLPPHPVALALDDDLERSRLTVFFRLLLAIPHLVWLTLWSVAAIPAGVLAWLIALVIGRVPLPFHRFLAAWVRYQADVGSFLYLVGGPFPGFTGAADSYPVGIVIEGPQRQRRLKTLFRLPLALPALILSGAMGLALAVVAFLGWFSALIRGRMPVGLRNLGAAAVRYNAQTNAYLWLVTDRYPYASPALTDAPPDSDEPLTGPDNPDLPVHAEAGVADDSTVPAAGRTPVAPPTPEAWSGEAPL